MDKDTVEVSAQSLFDQLFSDSFTESLVNMLGERAASATVRVLKLSETASRPAELLSRLRKLFGAGSQVIERVAMRDLLRRLDIPWDEHRNEDAVALVEVARRAFEKKGGKTDA